MSGPMKAGTLLELQASELHLYLYGLADGLLHSPVLGADKGCGSRMARCLDSTSPDQQAEMLRRHLQRRPELASKPAAKVAVAALFQPCLDGPPLE